MVRVVALTGGIASGKSEAQKIFAGLGVTIVDLDEIARVLSRPNTPLMRAVKAHFGADYFNAQNELNREKLGDLVFSNAQALADLNSIMHPAIYAEAVHIIEHCQHENYLVLSIPLLVESKRYNLHINHILVIDCSQEFQVERLVKYRGLSSAKALAMIRSQSSREQRLAIADTVIANMGSLDALQQGVHDFHYRFVSDCF